MHSCWTLEDGRNIAKNAAAGADVVLMGAGFIGCIILESLAERGVNLTVIEMEDRMVPRMMDQTAGNLIKQWCLDKGVNVLTSTRVEAIEQDGAARLSVQLDNGDRLGADVVISATGVRANTRFLDGSGIDTDFGVLVNDRLQSSHPDVYAAGDVCQGKDFSTAEYSVQAIQPTAADHGRIAAMNMSGRDTRHQGSVNMNVLDTMGLVSTSYGLWMGVDGGESVALVDAERYRYISLQFQEDVLVGAQALGLTNHVGVLRGLIQTKLKLGKWKEHLLQDPHQDYGGLPRRNPVHRSQRRAALSELTNPDSIPEHALGCRSGATSRSLFRRKQREQGTDFKSVPDTKEPFLHKSCAPIPAQAE